MHLEARRKSRTLTLVLKHSYHTYLPINDEYLTGMDMVSTSEDASPRETKDRNVFPE
jgi:hypothetical protein